MKMDREVVVYLTGGLARAHKKYLVMDQAVRGLPAIPGQVQITIMEMSRYPI